MGSVPRQSNQYDCSECPAYCCAIYERVQLTKRDLQQIARHFGLDVKKATTRFTTEYNGERILRRKADPIFGKACKFLNAETRQCTIYDARPKVCREFPAHPRCAYYDLLQFERVQQGDDSVVPLVQITFRNGD
ncbi:MAG TPA: YkgJ family cysteine cluster protein [Pyrinomonadaceae bacterium]|nr:YkgJ family cysteine cluster protein [Pyrinomonadaceae bacterium]